MTRHCLPSAFLLLIGAVAPAFGQAQFVLPGDLAAGVSAGDQTLPTVARGGSGWLAVWEDNRAAQGGFVQAPTGLNPNRDIYAARLDANGALIDTVPIVVNQDTFDQVKPRVAWNGTHWLVVWQSSRTTQFYVTSGIYAARVAPDGTVLDNPPILIEDGDDFDERDPIVASDGVNWLVVWNDYLQGAAAETLDGAIVHPLGFVTQKQTVLPGAQFTYPVNVDLDFAVDRYLVVYEKAYSGSYGRLVGTNLVPIGAEFALSTSATKPEVTSNGSDFFATFAGARGTPVSRTGVVAIPGGALYAGSGTSYGPETDCAWDGTNWVVAFSSLGIGGNDALYLSHVTPSGALVAGSPTTVTTANTIREFSVATGLDRAQVVWNDLSVSAVSIAGPDVADVFGAQVSPAGIGSAILQLSVSPATQSRPVIAGSASAGWLVGFLRRTSGVTQVCAQRLSGNGSPIDTQPIVLFSGDGRIRSMDVGFDGAHWLVVWDDNFGTLRHTFGRRVALDGSLPDSVPINYLRGERPAVSATEHGKFLIVAWDHNQSTEYIRAMRVQGSDGALLDSPYLTLGGSSGFPDVMGFDDRWIVASGGVSGTFVFEDGTVAPSFYFAQGASETIHGLARDGDMGILAFVASTSTSQNGNVHFRRFMKDGTLLDTNLGVPLCQALNRQFDPRAAFDGTNFRVTWTDYRAHPLLEPGLSDLYEAVIATDGSVVQLCGSPVANDVRIPEGDAEIAADAGIVVVAATVLHEELGGLRIEVHANSVNLGGVPFCFGDGSGTACPCGNASPVGADSGCVNSLGTASTLRAAGFASLSADTLELRGEMMPNSSALYFQGTQDQNFGAGLAFGDGLRCCGGSIVRIGTKSNAGGASSYPGIGDPTVALRGGISAPGVRYYQVWYRNAANFCAPQTFNLTNGLVVTWSP